MSTLIPINVLTGFLGSGKTSLLNRLLHEPGFSNCAVLVNEFGPIGVDHHLVDKLDGDIVLLPSGCICCTVRGDLTGALRDLFERRESGAVPPFERVVIETTGLADPVPILATVMHDRILRHHYRAGNVITTVDTLNGCGNLDDHPECLRQAALADRIVLTKLDLSDGAAVALLLERLLDINPTALVVRSGPGPIDAQRLLGDDLFELASRRVEVKAWLGGLKSRQYFAMHASAQPPDDSTVSMHADTRAISLRLPSAIDWTVFAVWLSLLLHVHGKSILRVKGLLDIAGADTPIVIHGVQQLIYPPVHLRGWPVGERESVLVFIVRGLDPTRIEASLHDHLGRYPRREPTTATPAGASA